MSKKLSTLRALPKIIVIVGPTASGKTALSIKVARKFNGEIISADSRQIYRGFNIGTAKPTKAEMKKVKHYLIDIKNPNEEYTVAQYKKDAVAAIRKILKNGKIPILVGGTGLYIKAVVDNLEIPKVKPNPKLRQKLERELRKKGLKYLYEKLIKLDPEAAYIIDRNNPRRVIRALEITLQSEIPFSKQRRRGPQLFNALKIGLNSQKEILKYRIDKRADQMVKNGLVDEVKNLIKKYSPDLPAFDAIGYREIINYLEDKISLNEAITLIKRNTWRYAKRQITWFKKDKEIKWIRNDNQALNLAKNFLKN
ncbi:tRNA (adenosine(37)-N6)-dimethylallyltransferase MiaA [Candidatus Wolfebacteria bacterium]|nr:tRNA (adenosine(37)-N6)-dimethylallyltransferase MiaA [Candidatus Wolfebacteria bacterium]